MMSPLSCDKCHKKKSMKSGNPSWCKNCRQLTKTNYTDVAFHNDKSDVNDFVEGKFYMKDLTFEDKCHIISKNLVHGIFKSHNIHTLAKEYNNIQIYDFKKEEQL